MGKIKGCINESCEVNKKKITYKDTESFCSKCGSSLVFVCKECYTQLPEDNHKYCVRCIAKHDDRKDKVVKAAAGVGTGVALAGGLAFKVGKKAFDVIKQFKV